MHLWRRGAIREKPALSVSQAAAAGASREELVRAAMRAIRECTGTDRIGVWTKQGPAEDAIRGAVWDASQETTPAEWTRLSPDIVLLRDLASQRHSVEQTIDDRLGSPMIGLLVGMRRALWIPLEWQEARQGLCMVASRRADAVFPRGALEAIAAELALALRVDELKSAAQSRQGNLNFAKRILAGSGDVTNLDGLLGEIVENGREIAGAGFLTIGKVIEEAGAAPQFSWSSGETLWTAQVESEPIKILCQRALESRRAIGLEPPGALPEGDYARIVAIPLEAGDKMLGVLVAGLRRGHSTLATLEWLELRAALAAAVLGRMKTRDQEKQSGDLPRRRIEKALEPIFVLNDRGEIVSLSDGARRLLAANLTARPGPSFAGLFRASDRENLAVWLRTAMEGGTGHGVPFDGELYSGARVRVRTPLPAGGDVFAVFLDPQIIETTGPSQSVAESELHTLLEWLEQGVVFFDGSERIRAMNSRFAQITGLDPAEASRIQTLDGLIERISRQAAEPEEMSRRWRELAQLGEGGVREELQLTHPVPRILERAARPVLDSAGRRIGWLELYRDLTAQRVFQSRLLQTEKLAALGQMVSGVAHELSNPLTSILGYAQRLLLREDTAQNREIQQIHQEAERASRMLRQLLQGGREIRPERKPVSLNQVVLRALELQRMGMASGQVKIDLKLDPSAPLLTGDADQLQQVVMNLVANARQAIEQERRKGTIRVMTRRSGDRRLRLEVSDDGPGIPPAILARIFDPFFTTKPAGIGTGLGLSIVLGIVREHGGNVHVANRPEGGTIFSIDLPALAEQPVPAISSEVSPPAPPARPPARSRAAGSSQRQRAVRVLVVEDEPTVGRLIADLLADEGMQVETLLDGREALARAAQRTYDLVICDLKMPGLDGQHFYQALARMDSPLRGRFIFVTGDALSATTLEFLERNHLPYVAKPFRVEELMQAVRGALKKDADVISKHATARSS